MSMSSSNNMSYTGFSIGAGSSEPVKTPSGVLVTRSVETKAGWVGQIILDKDIVWESGSHDTAALAVTDANDRVVDKLRRLFA